MTQTIDERLLADFSSLEPVYVDGVLGVVNLGDNFAEVYYRLVPVKSENGIITMQKVSVLMIVQPRSSLKCGKKCEINVLLDAQGEPLKSVDETPRTFN